MTGILEIIFSSRIIVCIDYASYPLSSTIIHITVISNIEENSFEKYLMSWDTAPTTVANTMIPKISALCTIAFEAPVIAKAIVPSNQEY